MEKQKLCLAARHTSHTIQSYDHVGKMQIRCIESENQPLIMAYDRIHCGGT